MARPRSTLVSIEDTPFYHCMSKCVRFAWLTGVDKHTGKSYAHRRDWVESRILELAGVFAIDVAAYAVMSNHLHLVLRVDIFEANNWTDKEVVDHWHHLFKGTEITRKFTKGEVIESYEVASLKHSIAQFRSRLSDISWFMRALNEAIARKANKEDGCTGRFWEGRFKSQALLDEAAVLACMAYVDLNPIRAKMANTPESSDFTSIQRRIKSAMKGEQPKALLPFTGNEQKQMSKGLMLSAKDYLQLVDETGRIIRADKHGEISSESQAILTRLNIPQENWIKLTTDFSRLFKGPVGTIQELDIYCEHLERKRRQGAANCQIWFSST
ncbi:transposase [Shewanella eurypsychrophilus]|uniref:Transposase n=1 Tax=Shewanella eurypsychrophilus TaxID=2593656 RepID=A0ABX6V4F4_9GAMM|nr:MULTISPECIES: transposase [Shewanella]QFU22202.1 transposase [Shewanella sp. YLB-09]QPG57488.1 transposase [Shewanella eurypsychrophilus]